MKNTILIFIVLSFLMTGCAKINPLSPDLNQKIDNQQGQIEDLKNNQNGVNLEIGKLRNQTELNARDIENAQQGILNLRGTNNSGVQILSGDGGLFIGFFLVTLMVMALLYYRIKAIKSEKTANILAQQIALYDDLELDNKVFLSALNTDVEKEVYHLISKNQASLGKK